MSHRYETRAGTVELLGVVCLVALGGVPLTGCSFDIFEGIESPCSRAGLDCEDGNPCTRDHCTNYIDVFGTGVSGPSCVHDPTDDGGQCAFSGIPGVCRGGLCGAEHLCEGVVCEDDDICTDDACAWDGTCAFTRVRCDDGNACTEDSCDAVTGICDFTTPAEDGSWCIVNVDSSMEVGGCEAGVCVGPCDSGSQEELPCPVEFITSLVCCPGSEMCLLDCSSEF